MLAGRSRNLVWVLVLIFLASNLFLAFRISNWYFVDETAYIPAAVAIVDGVSCQVSTVVFLGPTVCNYEHPPLVKVLEAVSLYAFGWVVPRASYANPAYGEFFGGLSSSPLWFLAFRFFQMVMGALSPALLYLIGYKISKNTKLALTAAALLLLEPLYAFFSRTAYLDIPMIFFALCAYAVYFGSYRMGPINEYWLAGVMFALSVLCKETGIVFVVPVIAYHVLFREDRWKVKMKEILTMIVGGSAVSVAGLQLYDTFARTPFPIFLDQIAYMFNYASGLRCIYSCPLGNGPLAWFIPFLPASWVEGLSWNMILAWLVFVWLAVGAHSLWRSKGAGISPEDKLFVFAALLFGSTLTENLLFFAADRITWIWYFLSIVPSLALGGAYLLTRQEIPKAIRVLVAVLLMVGFFGAYALGPNLLTYD